MDLPTVPPDGYVRVAAIQAQAQEDATEADFEHQILCLVKDAKQAGAQIVVFPEDVGLWLELSKRSPRILALRSIAALTSIANLAHGGPAATIDPSTAPEANVAAPKILNVPEFDVLLGRFTDWIAGLIHVPFFGEWLGQARIDRTYLGTMSLALVAATKRDTGSPARFANSPAVRFPKLPLGVENTISGVRPA